MDDSSRKTTLSTSRSDALIEHKILVMLGRQILLDADLAGLYGVATRALVRQVKRNLERFPADFMFEISREELEILRSQSVISRQHGGRRSLPLAFTEQGVAMLSGVLRSDRAIAVNIEIMRTFVSLRRVLAADEAFEKRIARFEQEVRRQLGQHDEQLREVFSALQRLVAPPDKEQRRQVGFQLPGQG